MPDEPEVLPDPAAFDPAPPSVEQVILNIGTAFTFGGKVYELRELTLEQKFRFTTWLRNRALAAVSGGAAADAPEHLRKELLAEYVRAAVAGSFDVGGDAFKAAMLTPAGQSHLVYVALNGDHPEVTEEVAERMVTEKHNEIAVQLMRAALPKFSGPAATGPAPSSRGSGKKKTSRSKKPSRSRKGK